MAIRDLQIQIRTGGGSLTPVGGISIDVGRGETVGIVGESGSGKSLTALSILRLPRPPVEIVGGQILFDGRDVLEMDERALRRLRGAEIGLVFQNASTALNPLLRVGEQISERIRLHSDATKSEARDRTIELLERVGIPSASSRIRSYPHEFSGGMAQRVMIAAAIANDPALLIADEPTTALDATTQAQIMELLLGLVDERGMSMILITHNLGLVAGVCDRQYVMYAGQIMETADTEAMFARPSHPYTRGLLRAAPRPDSVRGERVPGIRGVPPDLSAIPAGCAFFERCDFAKPSHEHDRPRLMPVAGNEDHFAACWIADEIAALPHDHAPDEQVHADG